MPQTYEQAKSALAACARIDECQSWADKAAALASYAKQANDDALMKMAVRIRAETVSASCSAHAARIANWRAAHGQERQG